LLNIQTKDSKFYLQLTRNNQIGILVTNTFRTLTGGTLYYDHKSFLKCKNINENISYLNQNNSSNKYKSSVSYRTIVWLGEEIYQVNCEPNILLVEHGDFISEGFELIPGLFCKTSGIVVIRQKNNLIQTISIKSGLVYEGKKFKNTSKKIYYPGEIILSNILIKQLSFCEHITGKNIEQLLLRPIEIYEFPYSSINNTNLQNEFNKDSNLKFKTNLIYSYKSNQKVRGSKNFNLVSHVLTFDYSDMSCQNELLNQNVTIELVANKKTKSIDLDISEKFNLNNFIVPNLRYKNIQPCFLIQPDQFVDKYTTLGYLEAITLTSLEIVKFKIKNKDNKQILLISNEDCLTVKKEKFPNKNLNDFIINSTNVNETGKVIIENNNLLTLQKGRPYFFPNCKNEDLINKTNLQYKIISSDRIYPRTKANKIKRNISLNYYDIMKLFVINKTNIEKFRKNKITIKTEFSKLLLKRNGKLYSSLIPQFLKKFSIANSQLNLKCNSVLRPQNFKQPILGKMDRTLLFQSSDRIQNQYKNNSEKNCQLTLVRFLEYPFSKTNRSIGLYSITEDYFEQDVNSVFCKNSEFIESGETIGLLNLEKEITGDIVQGLPRIEEILEARKKNITVKRMPTSQKKGLLIQKTSLDPNFEFRKLGTPIQENDKINPHKLLKVYFNYYGLRKLFVCDRLKSVKCNRLIENYEGSYKSFKKVQSFILNSVQSVYESQGVSINDKHLEVIIKQMTTKVLITHEGNTPLLRREVIDLYHIQYINQVITIQNKQSACYVPLLLGITKAALNNPSFISAASFQETTRVLTKAAIEGRIDWLRGLKENIIIGHLIPAGTGSKNYRNCFKKQSFNQYSLR
jgi:hypothetical protein